MIVDCISDLHGHYPELKGGDLLIVAGDLTKSDQAYQYLEWREWIRAQDYKKKVFVCGNHDKCIQDGSFYFNSDWLGAEWLNDSGTEFEGLKIYGSPWTKTFPGMNPHCKAFTVDTEEELAEKWALIPNDVDILVTHSPPYRVMDKIIDSLDGKIKNVGSVSLSNKFRGIKHHKLHVFGHIHEGHGIKTLGPLFLPTYVNASHVNEYYNPCNPPIRVELF